MKAIPIECAFRKIRSAAFTLPELLVALGVIGVLSGLLLGGLGIARSSAMDARCLQHLRQIGVGALSYFGERQGVLLPGRFFYTASFEADGGFRDYLGLGFSERTSRAPQSYYTDTVLTCPRIKQLRPDCFDPPALFNRGYTANEYALASEDGEAKPDSYPKRLNRIASPSEMMLITDGSLRAPSTAFHTTMNQSYVTRNYLLYPHSGSQYVLFMDGRVASVPELTFRQPQSPRRFWGSADLPE